MKQSRKRYHGRRETHSTRLTADQPWATTGHEAPAGSWGHFPPPQDGGKAHLGPTAGYGSNGCWVPAKPHFNSLFLCIELATCTVSVIKKKKSRNMIFMQTCSWYQTNTGLQAHEMRGCPQTIRIQIHISNNVLTWRYPIHKNYFSYWVREHMKNSLSELCYVNTILVFLNSMLFEATEYKGAFLSLKHLRQELLNVHRKL